MTSQAMPRSIDEPRPCRGTNPGVILARRDDSRPPSVVRGPWRAEIPACRLRACSGSLSAVPSPRRFTILNPRPSYQTIVANRLAAFRLQRLDDSEQPDGDGATRERRLFSQDHEVERIAVLREGARDALRRSRVEPWLHPPPSRPGRQLPHSVRPCRRYRARRIFPNSSHSRETNERHTLEGGRAPTGNLAAISG